MGREAFSLKLNRFFICCFALVQIGLGIYYLMLGLPYFYMIAFGGLFLLPLPQLIFRILRLKPVQQIYAAVYVFLFLSYTCGLVMGFYGKFVYYDKGVHFFSGIVFSFFALIFFYYLKPKKEIAANDFRLASAFSFAISIAIAALWEIAEYFYAFISGLDPQNVLATGVDDTMIDMIVCTAGALLFLYSIRLYYKMGRRTPLMAAFEAFVCINIEPNDA